MLALPVAVFNFGIDWTVRAQSAAPTTAAVSRVHQLEMEDQSENPGNISAAEYYRHGDARRAEIRKLLEEGKITSGEDFSDAALIFQHGQAPEDFLFAHVLAVGRQVDCRRDTGSVSSGGESATGLWNTVPWGQGCGKRA